MARPNIEQLRGLGDFATLYNWNIFIVTGTGVPAMTTMNTNLRCVSTELPILTNQKISIGVRSHKVHQPGIHQYNGKITFTFVETVDSKVNMWLKQWRERCWRTMDGYQFSKRDVQYDMRIERLDRQDRVIWKYELIGCFLENYSQPTIGADTNEVFQPTMEVSYDYFIDSGLSQAANVGTGRFGG